MLTRERTLPGIGNGIATLRAWRAERMPPVRFGPLALLLAGAACLRADAGWEELLLKTFVALMLLVQFRLWDDLVDANRDRSSHPERVLARSDDRRVFAAACIGLCGANAYVLNVVAGSTALTGFVLLNVLLGAWYGLHSQRGILHLHVLLLKYPVFVVLLGLPAWTHSMLAGAAATYASVCLFDLLGQKAPRTPALTGLLMLHGLGLALLALLPKVDVFGVVTSIAVAAIVAFACVESSGHRGLRTAAGGHAPFVATLLILVRHFLGGTA